ncbi:Pyruvate decarboxylase 3 [Aspergillus hancockii]|nr:Pyruvate decarboxylase 3 [Aspergillus hancockii]
MGNGGMSLDYHTLGNHLDINREQHRILALQDGCITTSKGEPIEWVAPKPTNGCTNDSSSLSVSTILSGIQDILRPNDALIAETGDSWFNAQNIRLPNGTDFHMQMVHGSIAWNLPAILGYQIGRPDGRVITMIGEGSFQMTAQEVMLLSGIGMSPPMFSVQTKIKSELFMALDRVEKEPNKLAILERCIQPDDSSPHLLRFGSAVGGGNADHKS